MKTRYSSLVSVKQNSMKKSERVVQSANVTLNSAAVALELSKSSLRELDEPTHGSMQDLLAARALLDAKRAEIRHNEEWVAFAKKQLDEAKEQLKFDMIEYEKFKYLELQEIKKMLAEQKLKEAKELDEVALMTHNQNKTKKAS